MEPLTRCAKLCHFFAQCGGAEAPCVLSGDITEPNCLWNASDAHRMLSMDCRISSISQVAGRARGGWAAVGLLLSAVLAAAQPVSPRPREFRPGAFNRIDDLPLGRFRTRLESLPAGPRLRAIGWLQNFHFTELD